MTAIASLLLSKGLPILAGALLNKVGPKLLEKIGSRLGLSKKATEKDIERELEKGLTEEQFVQLTELQHLIAVEEEVTKRLAIDNSSDSWLTRHIRPLSLITMTLAIIIFFFCSIFMTIETQQKADTIVALGNYLFMLNTGIFSFYFGGRSWEKVEQIKLDKVIMQTREEMRATVNEEDIPSI